MIQMKRKIRQGYVIRANQSKTVIVAVERWYKHQLYGKAMRRTKKYYVHDNGQICKVGDLVKIEETKPLSLMKRWMMVEVLSHVDVPEVKPLELDRQIEVEENISIEPQKQTNSITTVDEEIGTSVNVQKEDDLVSKEEIPAGNEIPETDGQETEDASQEEKTK